MRKVGLVSGYYPQVAASYHRRIVETVRERMGEDARPDVMLEPVAWPRIEALSEPGGMDELRACARQAMGRLEASGCELIVSGCDVGALALGLVRREATAKIMTSAEVIAREVLRAGYKRVIVLGNDVMCVLPCLKAPLAKAGVMVFTPGAHDRSWLDQVIADELERGGVREGTAERFTAMLRDGAEHGVDAIILGRFELGTLVEGSDLGLPVLDAQALHVEALVPAMTDDFEEGDNTL